MVYADNAATTKMSRTAIDAMLPYLETYYGNPSSLYRHGAGGRRGARRAPGRPWPPVWAAQPREITFTSGGSEADNQALISAARIGERKGKKHIISTAFEHHAVLHTLKKLEKEGFEVDAAAGGPATGTVTAQQVADAIRAGHLPGHHHVRQQRDRLHPAHCGDRRGLPGKGRPVPHRRRAGGGTSPHQREGAEHRHAVPLRPQVPRPQGRRRAVCPAGHPPDQRHRGRRAGAGQAGRYGKRPRHHGSWPPR